MDPTEALRRAREAAAAIMRNEGEPLDETDALELAEAFRALDAWLTQGGFLPGAWERPQR